MLYKDILKELIVNNLYILDENSGIITCKREATAFRTLYTIYVKNFTLGYISIDNYYNPTYKFVYDEKFSELPCEDAQKYAKKIIDLINIQIYNYNEKIKTQKNERINNTKNTLNKILME